MTVPIEDLIRDVQERQADRAVHPERIRAALPAGRRRHARQRRLGMIAAFAAVVAVAAVVTVPTLVFGGRGDGNRAMLPGAAQQSRTSTAPSEPPSPPVISPTALAYTVGSPPGGLIERIRWADTVGGQTVASQTRMWSTQPVDEYGDLKNGRLLLRTERTTGGGETSGLTTITVGGKQGWYDGIDAPDKSHVSWKPDADTLLTLEQHGLNISRTELVRIAESVRQDTATLAPVVTFGWLPGAFTVDHVGLAGNSGTAWLGDVNLTGLDGQDEQGRALAGPNLNVELGTSSTETGTGEPVTVRGHTGKLVNDAATGAALGRLTLVVDLGGGTWLTLSVMDLANATIGKEDLLHIAETLQIATPDLSWMGR
jgi:hypothetical protein